MLLFSGTVLIAIVLSETPVLLEQYRTWVSFKGGNVVCHIVFMYDER